MLIVEQQNISEYPIISKSKGAAAFKASIVGFFNALVKGLEASGILLSHVQLIENIQVWPVISFVIFFIFFLCLLLWVFTTDKKFIDKMSSLPVEEEQNKINSSLKTVEP